MPEDIRNFLNIGRLAPSTHNTQPWKVRISGDELIIGYDPQRQLRVGDPDKRELFISLGCFIETVVAAAQTYGYITKVRFIGPKPDGVVSITLGRSGEKTDPQRIETIKRRRSDRRNYLDKPIPKDVILDINNINQGSASINLFNDPKDIGFLSKMTYEATYETMSDPAFREELAGWVRHNWTRRPDGMPGYTQGIPGPISLFAKLVIRKNKKMAVNQAKMDSKRVAHSSAIGLVTTSEDNPEEWVDAGRVYQRACLAATGHDVRSAGTSAAVVVEDTAKKIRGHLKLRGTPVALIRFGYTKNVPKASPRRDVDEIATS